MRMLQAFLLSLLALVLPSLGHPTQPWSRRGLDRRYSPNAERAAAVKEAFQHSWKAYYTYAFPHDSLRPEAMSWEDDRNGWGATAVDGLGTAILMKDEEIVNQILNFIPKVDFTKTAKANDQISVFESTIRYVGGLLSGYDLLTGPFKDLISDKGRIDVLLTQARSLVDGLKIAFDTPSGVNDGYVFFSPDHRKVGNTQTNLAEAGTLVLEWTRLSDLTSDNQYANLTQTAEDFLLHPQPASSEPFPGLVGSNINLQDGKFVDSHGGWNGGDDSFYEYLIKMYVYDPSAFGEYKDRWVQAADSSIEYLTSHPTSRKDLTFLSSFNGKQTSPSSSHLACFDGGNFILGGFVLQEQKYIDFGIQLAESCIQTYVTPSGIGPEGFSWIDAETNSTNSTPPAEYADFYAKNGFWPTASDYVLRPEVLESVYYAYRATGDSKWQDRAWNAFMAINTTCRVEDGFAGLNNVMQADGGGHLEKMESFWLAETMKYLYIIFDEDSDWQVQAKGTNEFVFNTEAQVLRVRG
ncbi:Fc.00g073960.m01.CDS01 [Cosmosporella sp. VM-42]